VGVLVMLWGFRGWLWGLVLVLIPILTTCMIVSANQLTIAA
jgi:hypothetical protein